MSFCEFLIVNTVMKYTKKIISRKLTADGTVKLKVEELPKKQTSTNQEDKPEIKKN